MKIPAKLVVRYLMLACSKSIVFSPTKQTIYCFPRRLYIHAINNPAHLQSSFASHVGWGADKKSKKLWDRIPDHDKSDAHKNCYLRWRELLRRFENDAGINVIIEENVLSEVAKMEKIALTDYRRIPWIFGLDRCCWQWEFCCVIRTLSALWSHYGGTRHRCQSCKTKRGTIASVLPVTRIAKRVHQLVHCKG